MKMCISFAVIALAVFCPGEVLAQEASPVEPGVFSAILPLGRGALHLKAGPLRMMVIEEVGVESGETRQLWSGRSPSIPWFGRSSVLARRDGSHCIAIELHAGGSRYLQLVECAPRSVAPAEEEKPRSRLLDKLVFVEKAVGNADPKAKKNYDITSPSLVEFGGEVYMVGSAWWYDKGAPYVFLGKFADFLDGKTEVIAIESGIDPRAVVYEQQLVIALRDPANAQDILGQAPLRLFRSDDAIQWKRNELAVENSPRGAQSFELGVVGGDLLIASLAHKGAVLEFSKLDAETNAWTIYAKRDLPENTDLRLRNLLYLHGGVNLDLTPKMSLRISANRIFDKF